MADIDMDESVRLPLASIAEAVQGRISGDAQVVIRGIAPFESAGAGDITLAGSGKFLKKIDRTAADAVIVPGDFQCASKTVVQVENPQVAFARVLQLFRRSTGPEIGVSPLAHIGANFRGGDNIAIAPFAMVGKNVAMGDRVRFHPGVVVGDNVVMGDDIEIFPNVTILEGTRIGSRVAIHAGSVIGSDGFGYAPDGRQYVKIPHLGIVQIDDDVEIGACNTIDRAKFGTTHICRGVKTDNLVHIAHNVTVGADTVIVAQVGISGSVTIGSHAIIAGQAGVAGHLDIGDNTVIGPKAGIGTSVPSGQVVSGIPGMAHRTWLRVMRIMPRLPDMKKKLSEIEKRLRHVEEKQG